jgi:hypothetical protein
MASETGIPEGKGDAATSARAPGRREDEAVA